MHSLQLLSAINLPKGVEVALTFKLFTAIIYLRTSKVLVITINVNRGEATARNWGRPPSYRFPKTS